jgi:tetratricopeptide (TPR) repeat protein
MVSTSAFSQKHFYKAERQFELKAFDLAIQSAKRALEKDPACIECHYLIAESFRMMNENVDAALWYGKMEALGPLAPEYAFNYGLLLKRMGEYEKAKTQFKAYEIVDKDKSQLFESSCDFAIATLSSSKEFEVNLYGPSSRNTDFGPTVFKNKLVFSSFRTDFKRQLNVLNTSNIQNDRCQFFISDLGLDGHIQKTDFLLSNEYETFDMGPLHYAAQAPLCAVTKHNFKDGEKQIFSDDLELSLFTAHVQPDGSFTNLVAFPFNEVGYATGFGTLNPTGKIMYFASNRPGGFGGFDIYVSYFKNNAWTYPENLGNTINSAGNEITPFFDGETLYFSSDMHMGLGGFDVFKSTVNYGEWHSPINMGNGVNSPEDDYYFTKHPDQESYYLTSNRLGGRGHHDIYLVHKGPDTEILASSIAPEAVNLETDVIDDSRNVQTGFVSLEESEIDNSIEDMPAAEIIAADLEIMPDAEPIIKEAKTDSKNFKSETGAVNFDELIAPRALALDDSHMVDVSLAGAKRVAYGEVIASKPNVYFIQLAALFKSQANMSEFNMLTRYGSLYKVHQSRATKVKLGYFMDENQAKEILRKVRAMGYNDAFITFEELNTTHMELVEVSDQTTSNYAGSGFVTEETTGSHYKVRLASYEDPIWFDMNRVNDLGIIEQWSKKNWTIFVISGYHDLEGAKKAQTIARERGFKDAEIVIDRDGILEKVN